MKNILILPREHEPGDVNATSRIHYHASRRYKFVTGLNHMNRIQQMKERYTKSSFRSRINHKDGNLLCGSAKSRIRIEPLAGYFSNQQVQFQATIPRLSKKADYWVQVYSIHKSLTHSLSRLRKHHHRESLKLLSNTNQQLSRREIIRIYSAQNISGSSQLLTTFPTSRVIKANHS